MKNHNLFFLFLLIFSACKSESGTKEPVPEMKFPEVFDNKEKINLSKISSSSTIQYIQLETNKNSILNNIMNPNKNIKFSKNRIFIKDESDNLLVFDKQGAFLNKIGEKGRGPMEYIGIDEFCLIPKKNWVVVFSAAQQRAIIYDYTGNYKKSFQLDFWPLGMSSLNKENLVFVNTIGRRHLTNHHSLTILSTEGKLKDRLLRRKAEIEFNKEGNELGLKGFDGSLYTLNDTLHYFEGSSYMKDTIWQITESLKAIPKFTLDYNAKKMPLEEHTTDKVNDFSSLIRYDDASILLESDRYIFLKVYHASERRLNHIFYDKKMKKGHSLLFQKENGDGVNFAFYNDLDNGMSFWPLGKVSDNEVFQIVHGSEIRERLSSIRFEDDINKEELNNLYRLVKNSESNDNPILMIISLEKR